MSAAKQAVRLRCRWWLRLWFTLERLDRALEDAKDHVWDRYNRANQDRWKQ